MIQITNSLLESFQTPQKSEVPNKTMPHTVLQADGQLSNFDNTLISRFNSRSEDISDDEELESDIDDVELEDEELDEIDELTDIEDEELENIENIELEDEELEGIEDDIEEDIEDIEGIEEDIDDTESISNTNLSSQEEQLGDNFELGAKNKSNIEEANKTVELSVPQLSSIQNTLAKNNDEDEELEEEELEDEEFADFDIDMDDEDEELEDFDIDMEDEDEENAQVQLQTVPQQVQPVQQITKPIAFGYTTVAKTNEPEVAEDFEDIEEDFTFDDDEQIDDDEGLLDDMDIEDEDEEQYSNLTPVKSASNIVAKNFEKSLVEEQIPQNSIERGQKSANSFENFEHSNETLTKEPIFVKQANKLNVQFEDKEQNFDFEEIEVSDIEETEEFDQSLIDSIPEVKQSVEKQQTDLEIENERLKRQVYELENEKLKKQIETLQKEKAKPVQMNLGIMKPANIQQKQPEVQIQKVKTQEEQKKDEEQQDRIRWAKYAKLDVQELWRLVYKFMTMAGVAKAPVKTTLLYKEFGSHNIKRLEASYIMRIKDGYTC